MYAAVRIEFYDSPERLPGAIFLDYNQSNPIVALDV